MQKSFIFITALLVSMLVLISCQSSNDDSKNTDARADTTAVIPNTDSASGDVKTMPEHLQAIAWVKSADASKDLKQAIANKDFRFFVLAARAPVVPGVDPKQASELLSKCGQKFLPGMGDVLVDDEHAKLHAKGIEYAKQYNQQLQPMCSELKQ